MPIARVKSVQKTRRNILRSVAVALVFVPCRGLPRLAIRAESRRLVKVTRTIPLGENMVPIQVSNDRLLEVVSLSSRPVSNVGIVDLRDGHVTLRSVWFSGAVNLRIISATLSPSSDVLVSGAVIDANGAVAYFITRIDSGGSIHNEIRTNPFEVTAVCSLPEGTIATLGVSRKKGISDQYRVFRRWDWSKGLVGAAVPHESFPLKTYSSSDRVPTAYLRCTGKRTIGFEPHTGSVLMIADSDSGPLVVIPHYPMNRSVVFDGFEATDSKIYASAVSLDNMNHLRRDFLEVDISKLQTSVDWTILQTSTLSPANTHELSTLIGADDYDLISYDRPAAGQVKNELQVSWLHLH
jgi:hypothetical protein